MINVGEQVVIDKETYVVTETPVHCVPCSICDVHNCYLKKGIQSLKAKHFAYTCEDLIGLHRHFKKAEGEQQASPSNQQIA